MKKVFFYIALLAVGINTAGAQVGKVKKAPAKKAVYKSEVVNKEEDKNPISITNWGHYNAKKVPFKTLSIADPTINVLNRRANGEHLPIDAKDILGVPKITYGLIDGQLLFRSRGATTSGTSTGNGAVGTGSGLGPIGISGFTLGVNGKSPYAGPIMDGIIVTGLPQPVQPDNERKVKKVKGKKQQ